MNTYIEITRSDHNHGGYGWEYGTCLWSPARFRNGADGYSLMREVRRNDRIIHFYEDVWPEGVKERRIAGFSFVKNPYIEINEEPPSPGDWANMSPYYKIELRNYKPFTHTLSIRSLIENYGDEIFEDYIENKPYLYPFVYQAGNLRTSQGRYLAKPTIRLINIIMKALEISYSQTFTENNTDLHKEYNEAKRTYRERTFFTRNPKLANDAKNHYGYDCALCGFNFENFYGEIGRGYIEAHHLNPLSERDKSEWTDDVKTNLKDVAVVCSNCHRMIHRKRPAYTLEEIKMLLREIDK